MNKKLTNRLKICLLLLFVIISDQEGYAAQKDKRILITDYGYTPGSRKNAIPAVKKALEKCKSMNDSVTVVFPRGRYDFWQDFAGEEGYTTGITLESLKNLTIDGDSSEFIFHGNLEIIYMDQCENVRLTNFSVDWDYPFMLQGNFKQITDDYVDMSFDNIAVR